MDANDSIDPNEAARAIKDHARALGFSIVGIAAADVPLGLDFERYRAAIADGLHGPLGYLAENPAVRERLDTDEVLEGSKSVIVVGARYDREDEASDPEVVQRIARYARGQDYHGFLRKKLRRLAVLVRALGPKVQARPLMDTAPVLERAWAARAGVGFVGKNGLVIAPGIGSELLLGEIVTNLRLAVDAPIEERCGRCTLCLDACPTKAFVRPFVLDARKCISTWTIEVSEPVPLPLREAASEHLFGCDVCQEVCPFNAKGRPEGPLAARHRPLARFQSLGTHDLARLGMPGGPNPDELLEGTPLSRAGVVGLARNACMVLGHEGRAESLELLSKIAEEHPSAVVREAASWAMDAIARKTQAANRA